MQQFECSTKLLWSFLCS